MAEIDRRGYVLTSRTYLIPPQLTTEDPVNRLPSDTEERVTKAKERMNRPVRDALREETGLTLNRINPDRHAPRTNFAVPIAIEPGLPEMLVPRDEQKIADEHWISVVLAPYRYSLVRDSSREIMDNLEY